MEKQKQRLYVIGVTGPSGAGKSFFCDFFRAEGYKILDCDRIYAKMTSYYSGCMKELSDPRNFGPDILLPDGSLDRKKMASAVFAEGAEDKLLLLNKITHKYVKRSIRRSLSYRPKNCRGFVIDAPLLFQAGLEKECDITVALIAERALRVSRLKERDGISSDAITARLSAAKPDSWYTERADVTVINDGDASALKKQADAIMEGRPDTADGSL
ncbi:MAG: dephospho-CoA kinase [Clostridia bacterium]|nr:dephospho-CoA kinase [Clostridia bacterium]